MENVPEKLRIISSRDGAVKVQKQGREENTLDD